MDLKSLLEYLDIESPDEFEYFENLADLIEADIAIEPEVVYALFSEMDMDILAELITNYFEELTDNLPGDSIELFTLLNTVKLALVGMSKHIDEDHDMVLFAEEFCRFRDWYSVDSTVFCQKLDSEGEKAAGETSMVVRDAIVLFRMEKLGEEKFIYDFDECLDFEMDEYSMTFAELIEDEEMRSESSELPEDKYDDFN